MTAPDPIPAAALLLADNLDRALAAGEDMLKCSMACPADAGRSIDQLSTDRIDQRRAIAEVRQLEAVLIARLLNARDIAIDLGRRAPLIMPLARLYKGGTAALADAAAEYGDRRQSDFDAGDDPASYLRRRDLIGDETPASLGNLPIAIGEEFLVAGRIRLGTLLDLAAMFLDVLETHFDLYPEQAGGTPRNSRTEPLGLATV